MSAAAAHMHIHARDPTRTAGIRRRFEAEMRRRFRALARLIREGVGTNDALGLKDAPPLIVNRDAPAPRAFDYPRSHQKVAAFMEWLRQAQADEILGVQPGVPISTAAEQAWTRSYIQTSYQQGIAAAGARLKREGATVADRWVDGAWNRPVHADRVGLIYTRAYEELKGVTDVMDTQISRVLAQGIAEGRSPSQIATAMNNRVDKIGLTRARVIARTEVVRASQQASLNAYREAGIKGVDVEVEVGLGPDPCPICQDLSSRAPFTLDEFGSMFPAHPNCVCAPIPRVVNGTGIRLE